MDACKRDVRSNKITLDQCKVTAVHQGIREAKEGRVEAAAWPDQGPPTRHLRRTRQAHLTYSSPAFVVALENRAM